MFSQNIPLTRNNILKQLETNFTNWTSGNEKINNFIQERQLKINNYGYDIVLEWIPYNQFNEIKETGKNGLITVYSAIWKDGPLYKTNMLSNYKNVLRNSNKKVALKCLHNSQESIDSLINEAKKYPTKHEAFQVLYGISQNPNTGDYILVQSNTINLSGNEKIDDFIQERQLKVNNYDDVVFEWIPYNQFNKIKETSKDGLITVYSAMWKDGPLYKKNRVSNYTRDSNKKVALKCLHNLQESVDSLINEAKKYPTKHEAFQVLYGISQNPDTGDYILIQSNIINFANWISGNEKIDNFIQERQLKINYNDVVFEWIPYNQFDEIKETSKNGLITVYSALWKDGPLYKMGKSNYIRNLNEKVALKCLHNLQESVDSLINEAKKYPTKHEAFQVLYGISQNPNTGDYILVQSNTINLSGNEKIDDFIQERQLKVNNYDDIVFEWIPYNQFNKIKETGKNGLMTVYSAIWKNGPLYKKNKVSNYTRGANKKVALKCLHNLQESIDSLINEAKKYPTKHEAFQVLYGISQNPDTDDYFLVQNYTINLVDWISGNKKIDDFIQERQLKINNYNDIVLEWIPYDQFNGIKETACKNNLITVYSAIWKNGPLYKKYRVNNYTRDSNKEVALKVLHNSQESAVDSLINEAKKYSTKHKEIQVLYGLSQNPDTGDYILIQNNYLWTSGNEKIDNFIQKMKLKVYNYDDVVLEWIPYNQFNEIKEIGKNDLITVYSAIWKNGPLYKKNILGNYYTRDSNKKVTLKCLHNSQESIDSLINEAKKYSIKYKAFQVLYGISQNPDTGDYIFIQNNYLWTSENKKIDDFIQKRQLKINGYGYDDMMLEWIPYNQFNEIKKIGQNGFITVYSAIWKDGPLYCQYDDYTRNSNKEVALKCLHNSQESIDSLINEAKKYPIKNDAFQVLYGISQNPDTGDYILVQNYTINLANWISGNEKIDDFIQEKQLIIDNYNDIVFEWIPYNQFNEIKGSGENGLLTVYSAIWKDGPLYKTGKVSNYARDSNKKVALKCLYNSQESIDSLINEAKKYPTNYEAFQMLYGLSQNPDTGDYILVQGNTINLANWISGNEKIDDFIQERQLKINNYDDIVFEWIPYNQFNEIKETSKNGPLTVYSAIWKDGPLHYQYNGYVRNSNKEISLKSYLQNSQGSIDFLINEAKKYSTKHEAFLALYGISQNPDTGDYILVQSNTIGLANCISGNEKIDDFIRERQLKINNYDIVFEWIPYNQFNEIKKIGKNSLITVYSAIWKDGPLYKMDKVSNYTRNLNKKVALKCLHNSRESIDSLINEAKKYSTKRKASQVLYGISQNPDTGDYILIQNNYRNEKIDDFTQERQLSEPSIAMGVDQEDYSFIISDKVQEELQKIVNDTNVRDIFFGRDHNDKVSSNKNQKLYIIVNNNPTEPLQMIENFPVTYIECGTFSEKIPRNIPPQKSFPLDIKEKFDSILDDQIGINFRSKYCNLIAISLDWKIVNREYVNKPAIVFYVIRKGIIPIGDDLLPETIYGIDTDVREGFYEPTGIAYEYCREYTAYLASGYSIGICNFRAGTLGAFVKNSNDKICLLSNYHVLNSNDNSIIEHIVKQPAYMDHVGAIEEKIEETEKNLARAIDDDNNREKDRKSKEKKLLEDKLKDANEEVTEFARVIDGKRENCYIGGKFYGVDAAIASLELIDRDVKPKEFAIPDFAFKKYSLTVPKISGSISIKDIKSFDTDNNIFKVGRTTGLTKGRIPELSGIDISCDPMRNLWVYKRQLRNLGIAQMAEINDLKGRAIFQPRWLSRQILVKQTDTGSFMDEGDSGCIWFDKKGMIIALGHGVFQNTNSVIAIGSPINAVLKALNVELYLGDN